MDSLLLWLSGADSTILSKCRESEITKHKGFGSLVLVPSMLALVSMFYALYTISKSYIISGVGAVIWCIVVLIFDRFVVSTVRKSKSVWRDIASIVFVSRIIFASFIGFVIADPLVLLIFNESIDQKIQDNQRITENEISVNFNNSISELKSENARYNILLQDQKALVDCLENLKTGERDGTGLEYTYYEESSDTIKLCGRSSSRSGRGDNFDDIELRIENEQAYLVELRLQYESLIEKNESRISSLENQNRSSIQKNITATDYLSRKRALGMLASDPEDGKRVFYTEVFLILLFVFVDILPVTWKVLTKRGAYDDYLETYEHQIKIEQEVQRNISELVTNELYASTVRVDRESEFEMQQIGLTMKEVLSFIESMEFKRKQLESIIKNTKRKMNSTKDPIERKRYEKIINTYQINFDEAFEKTSREFNSYLKLKNRG